MKNQENNQIEIIQTNNDQPQALIPRSIENVHRNMPVEQIFQAYITQFSVSFDHDEHLIRLATPAGIETYSLSSFETRVLVDFNSNGLSGVDKELTKRLISSFVEGEIARYFLRIKDQLAYSPNADNSQLPEFVSLLCGPENSNYELDVSVFRHFIWQIKRKLNNLPVEHHMMPVVVGEQGIGKSEAIRKLLEPLGGLVATPPDFNALNDERNSYYFVNYAALFFDEMAKASKADINVVKKNISSTHVMFRQMYTNQLDRRKNMATFLGCANNSVADTINDPTGMRRFWEINARKKDEQWHETSNDVWRQINALDYFAMWRSVDETAPSPILSVLREIHSYQEKELRYRDSVEEFLEQEGWIKLPKDSNEKDWVESKSIYLDYKKFCEVSGLDPVSSPYMGRRFKALGVLANKSKNNRKYALVQQEEAEKKPLNGSAFLGASKAKFPF